MPLDRRRFLTRAVGVSAAAATGVLSGCTREAALSPSGNGRSDTGSVYKHGVASGDPTSSAVILWTRISNAGTDGFLREVPVDWAVYDSLEAVEAGQARQRGNTLASPDNDNCVKVDVTGLPANRWFYYQFTAEGEESVIGRTRTLPEADELSELRVAVLSCSNYAHGYFHVYRDIAERNDVDLCVHTGDYIYEYEDGAYGDIRVSEPINEMVSLSDYRLRHAQYKTDPDSQLVHQNFPWINVWDDHEITNNSRRCTAENHTDETEGDYYARKGVAGQVYFEWLPIRPAADDARAPGDLFAPREAKIWRKFSIGNLADLIMVDTRIWKRDDQAGGAAFTADGVREYQSDDPRCGDETTYRDMLGPDQEAWLHEQITSSTATWKILGNQIMFSHWQVSGVSIIRDPASGDVAPVDDPTGGLYVNTDAWDGYPTSQERLFDVLDGSAGNAPVDNFVVLSGDIHSSWAMDVTRDPEGLDNLTSTDPTAPRYQSLGVEFITPSVSSPTLVPAMTNAENAIIAANPHMRMIDLSEHGWVMLSVKPEAVTAEWWWIGGEPAVDSPTYPGPSRFGRAFGTQAGRNYLLPVFAQSTPVDERPPLAPTSVGARSSAPEFTDREEDARRLELGG